MAMWIICVHEYCVEAENPDGVSARLGDFGEAWFFVPLPPPDPPGWVIASDGDLQFVAVTWDPIPIGPFMAFNVYRDSLLSAPVRLGGGGTFVRAAGGR